MELKPWLLWIVLICIVVAILGCQPKMQTIRYTPPEQTLELEP